MFFNIGGRNSLLPGGEPASDLGIGCWVRRNGDATIHTPLRRRVPFGRSAIHEIPLTVQKGTINLKQEAFAAPETGRGSLVPVMHYRYAILVFWYY
jgi:hypothetical protein